MTQCITAIQTRKIRWIEAPTNKLSWLDLINEINQKLLPSLAFRERDLPKVVAQHPGHKKTISPKTASKRVEIGASWRGRRMEAAPFILCLRQAFFQLLL